jgi:hypothetical protein
MGFERKKKRIQVGLAVEAEVMVTFNVDANIDIANRTIVERIVLDSKGRPFGTNQVVELQYLPFYILFRLERTRASQLPALIKMCFPYWLLKLDTQYLITKMASKHSRKTISNYSLAIVDIADSTTGRTHCYDNVKRH